MEWSEVEHSSKRGPKRPAEWSGRLPSLSHKILPRPLPLPPSVYFIVYIQKQKLIYLGRGNSASNYQLYKQATANRRNTPGGTRAPGPINGLRASRGPTSSGANPDYMDGPNARPDVSFDGVYFRPHIPGITLPFVVFVFSIFFN